MASRFGGIPVEEAPRSRFGGVPVATEQPEQQGFLGRTGEALQQRGATLADIVQATDPTIIATQSQTEQPLLTSAVQAVGTEVGAIGDIAGEAVRAGVKALPSAITDPLALAGEGIKGFSITKAAMNALQSGAEAFAQFKEKNPKDARSIEAVLDIAGIIPATRVAKPITSGAKELVATVAPITKEAVEQAKNKALSIVRRETTEALETEDLRALSAEAYKRAADAGENFPNTVRRGLISSLKKGLPGAETLRKGGNDIQAAHELMKARKGKPLTLEGAQQIDEELGQLISKNYRDGLNADGKKLLDIQDEFRTKIESSEGGKLLKEARGLWSASKRMEDINRIIEHAEFTDNPATSIKHGLRTLLKSKKRTRGYTKKELDLIKRGAKSGVLPNTLRTVVGSRLISTGLGGVLGGAGGAIAGSAISGAARKVSEGIAKRSTSNIIEEIAKRGK